MKVATFNANSIRSRMPAILDWLAKESPDVLCVQETKVQDVDFPAKPLEAAGYHVIFKGQKAHAGVAIISREPLNEVAFGIDDGGEPDEARLIRGVIQDVVIINTYVPQGRSVDSPHFQYKLEWFARLRDLFERHYSPAGRLLWLGDFNVATDPIDVHDPKRLEDHVDYHPLARDALQRVKEWGWIDLYRLHHPDERQYTYYDYRVRDAVERGVGWRVDHIWGAEAMAEKCVRSWIDLDPRLGEKPSDHTFLVAEFAL
jgi:exodeoxyribonuclease III